MGDSELRRGGSWMGPSFGDLFEALYKPADDMGAMNLEQGGVDRMAS